MWQILDCAEDCGLAKCKLPSDSAAHPGILGDFCTCMKIFLNGCTFIGLPQTKGSFLTNAVAVWPSWCLHECALLSTCHLVSLPPSTCFQPSNEPTNQYKPVATATAIQGILLLFLITIFFLIYLSISPYMQGFLSLFWFRLLFSFNTSVSAPFFFLTHSHSISRLVSVSCSL